MVIDAVIGAVVTEAVAVAATGSAVTGAAVVVVAGAVALLIWPEGSRWARLVRIATAGRGEADGLRAERAGYAGRRSLWEGFHRRSPGRDHAARVRALVSGATVIGVAAALRVAPWPLPIAGLLIGYTAVTMLRHARAAARARRELTGVIAALRGVVRELQAGAPPRAAVDHVSSAAAPAVRRVLDAFARAEPVPDPAPRRVATTMPGAVVDQLRRAWAVSVAHGVPLAALLSACVADLEDRAALARLRAQHVAGPAVSGCVLAALPVAGIAMGAGMGSHPVDVLMGSALGGVLLVAGVGLCCAGLLWAGRIVRGGHDD